jgi:hypothetical protein
VMRAPPRFAPLAVPKKPCISPGAHVYAMPLMCLTPTADDDSPPPASPVEKRSSVRRRDFPATLTAYVGVRTDSPEAKAIRVDIIQAGKNGDTPRCMIGGPGRWMSPDCINTFDHSSWVIGSLPRGS